MSGDLSKWIVCFLGRQSHLKPLRVTPAEARREEPRPQAQAGAISHSPVSEEAKTRLAQQLRRDGRWFASVFEAQNAWCSWVKVAFGEG